MTQTEPNPTLDPLSTTGATVLPTARRRFRFSRKWWIGGGMAIASVVGFAVLGGGSESAAQAVAVGPVNTAQAAVTDLVEEVSLDGTLGSVAGNPIVSASTGVVTDLAAAGSTLVEADVLYQIDNQPVVLLYGETPLHRDLALGSGTTTVIAPGSGVVTDVSPAGTILEQGDIAYWVDGEPVTVLYGEVPAYRDLFDSEPEATSNSSSQVATVQATQQRQGLLDAIAEAEDALDTATLQTPSVSLLNAIDRLTELEFAGVTGNELSVANQALVTAQNADLDRLEAARGEVSDANQALAEFDALQAAAAADEAAATVTSTVVDLTGNDIRQLETALAAMGYDLDGTLTIDDEFTYYTRLAVEAWQADLGAEVDGAIELGDVIFVPGPSQIVDLAVTIGQTLTPGSVVARLTTGVAETSPDVEQVEQSLADLGYGDDGAMVVDGVYTAETRQAIIDWQSIVGQDPDGVINLGEVVFLPGPIRVADQLATTGATVNQGAPVLAVSSAEQVVRVNVPAAEQALIEAGDPVAVILPGFVEAPATVLSVSSVATIGQDGEALFEAIVELDDPTVAAGLDEAPVDVIVDGDSATGVLAVPVTALVALTEGGYAVEVQTEAGGFQLVAVEPGFFAGGLVEVSSSSLSAGDVVTLP